MGQIPIIPYAWEQGGGQHQMLNPRVLRAQVVPIAASRRHPALRVLRLCDAAENTEFRLRFGCPRLSTAFSGTPFLPLPLQGVLLSFLKTAASEQSACDGFLLRFRHFWRAENGSGRVCQRPAPVRVARSPRLTRGRLRRRQLGCRVPVRVCPRLDPREAAPRALHPTCHRKQQILVIQESA